ncbi:GH3 domain-containing protein isoform X2 [Sminthopsis crassicaudata]|uniref:GH3 domain-containing protein isoform X2 n=1 Tax=Sminthopsis crassicaudata TaxID=9301 RepID=UPI003D68072C
MLPAAPLSLEPGSPPGPRLPQLPPGCHEPGRSSYDSPVTLLEPPMEMLLLLLLLLFLPLTLLWWQRSRRLRKAWGHRVALRALGWAAAWTMWRLEESTRHAHQSQKQTLQRCLQGPQTATCLREEIPDLDSFRNQFPLVWPCLDPHSKTGGSGEGLAKLQHPPSNPTSWESSLQVARESGKGVSRGRRHPTKSPEAHLPLGGLALRRQIPQSRLVMGVGEFKPSLLQPCLSLFPDHIAEFQFSERDVSRGTGPRRHCPFDPHFPLALLPPLAPEAPGLGLSPHGRSRGPPDTAFSSSWSQGCAGVIGLNLCPKQRKPGYLLLPGPPFVELLPAWERSQEEVPCTLLLGEALQGKEYELVLTSGARLTRCPLGDVVQVIDFYNQCPIVRFVRRLGQSLNVRGEGVSEDVFSGALLCAVGLWPGAKLLDYCCTESSIVGSFSDASAPHYEVFVELRGVRGLSEDHRHKLDHCLQEASPTYKSLRFRGSIGPAQVHLVGQGGFSELRTLLSSSPSFMPFSSFPPEMPRILKHRDLVQFLLRRVVS